MLFGKTADDQRLVSIGRKLLKLDEGDSTTFNAALYLLGDPKREETTRMDQYHSGTWEVRHSGSGYHFLKNSNDSFANLLLPVREDDWTFNFGTIFSPIRQGESFLELATIVGEAPFSARIYVPKKK